MAYINDIEVRISSLVPTIKRKVKKNDMPGSNVNPIDTFGFSGLSLRVSGHVTSRAEYDRLMAELNNNVAVDLSDEDGWHYHGTVEKITPSSVPAKNFIPFGLSIICETSFKFSNTLLSYSADVTTKSETIGGAEVTTNGSVDTVATIEITSELATGIIVAQTDKI